MIYNIVGGTNKGRAKVISPVEIINFYPEIQENPDDSNVPAALIGCPGYRNAVEAYSQGQCRALKTISTERMFTIVSNKLVEITIVSGAEVATERGTLSTSIGNCSMCDNGTELFIVDGTYGYIYTLSTNTLAVITDQQFPSDPTGCIFTDGYFITLSAGTGKFYFSASYDGTSWAALDFATAEYSADNLVNLEKTSNGILWMLGKFSLEQWQGTGDSNLPWQRINGSVKEIGCIAPSSVASNGNQIFFLGNGLNGYAAVYMGSGFEVTKISTHAIEYQIKKLVNIDEAVAFVYSDEGHSFYVISFTTERTFVFDLSTGKWHERGSYNTLTGFNIRQFAQWCAFLNGKYYVGSYLNGNIYEMSNSLKDEAGEHIKGVIVPKNLNYENKLIRHNKLEIEIEKRVGIEDNINPTLMLQFSDDGGHTWSNEIWKNST